MAALETFHERQMRLRGDLPDVYVYDNVPKPLRVQIVQIMEEVLGDEEAYDDMYGSARRIQQAYKFAVELMRKSIGEFRLPPASALSGEDFRQELRDYLLTESHTEKFMSAVELVCRLMERIASDQEYRRVDKAAEIAAEGISDINARMRQHGVGYEYDRQIIRIDSELVHAEAVKPALSLLRETRYAGAQQEFLNAFDHYRGGNTKEALTDALKSIESTLKVIYTKREWTFHPHDPIKKLLEVAFTNGLIPPYWQSHFTSLRSMLESSVPTARNRTSGHGQGVEIREVPDYLASYVLHMSASTIVFLVKAEQALPPMPVP